MPYQKSKARKAFEADVNVCIDAIRQLDRDAIQNSLIRDYVRSNAVLKTSVEVESYFEDVISDWLAELNANPRPIVDLPPAVRVRHLVSGPMMDVYRRYIAFSDENQFSRSLGSLLGIAEMEFATNGITCPPLVPSRILDGKKYPSVKNLKILFGRLGMENIFGLLNASAGRNMKLLLESFNDVRGSLAHVGWPVAYTDDDVKNLIATMKIFVHHLDQIFYEHAVHVGGSASWRT